MLPSEVLGGALTRVFDAVRAVVSSKRLGILAYNFAVYFTFMFAYHLYGFTPAHFQKTAGEWGEAESHSLANAAYYALIVHTTIGFGDFVPRTRGARLLTGLHAALVWAQVAVFV